MGGGPQLQGLEGKNNERGGRVCLRGNPRIQKGFVGPPQNKGGWEQPLNPEELGGIPQNQGSGGAEAVSPEKGGPKMGELEGGCHQIHPGDPSTPLGAAADPPGQEKGGGRFLGCPPWIWGAPT